MAAFKGHESILHLLINKGADINIQNQEMLTPMHVAVSNQKHEIALMIITEGLKKRPFEQKPNFRESENHLYKGLSRHWDQCRTEIIAMQNQIIGHTHDEKVISLYDFICLEEDHTLLKYMGNRDFQLIIKDNLQNYQREFPHYFNHIQANLDKVEKVSNENTAMKFITQTMKLDELAAKNITKYLKDDIDQIKDMANAYRTYYKRNIEDSSNVSSLKNKT